MTRRLILASLLIVQGVGAQNGVRVALNPQPLSIVHLDVGQGDAVLIRTPEDKRILIDAGPNSHTVADMLREIGMDTLDLVIATHANADHIGGMAGVLLACAVRAYLDNGIPYTTATYRRTLDAVEKEQGLLYLRPTQRTITVGSVTLRVLPPPLNDRSQNNNSVGVVVEYGQFRALYTGDSEREELTGWLGNGLVPQVTLLKAAHHGADDGVTPNWAKTTSPTVVVISVGGRNQYGHPSARVERMWSATGTRVYRTDRVGQIEVDVNPDGTFTVRTSAVEARGR